MTVQSSEGASQTSTGSVDRSSAWIELPGLENIKCHIQEKSKQTVTERFSKLQEEHNDLIYHQNQEIYDIDPQAELRIIVWKANPHLQINFDLRVEDADLQIYTFKGHIEQVKGVRRHKSFFILRCERNDMWHK